METERTCGTQKLNKEYYGIDYYWIHIADRYALDNNINAVAYPCTTCKVSTVRVCPSRRFRLLQ